MRDPDTGLHMEYFPLHAQVPMARLEQAWEWAKASEHSECRYAVWAIARNHATAPRTLPHHDAPSIMWNNAFLFRIWELWSEFEANRSITPAEPDLSSLHCRLTQAGAESGHPEAQVLVRRILEARAAEARGSFADRKAALFAIWSPTDRLEQLLADDLKFTQYPVPRLRALFTAEEVVCREALCWAKLQPVSSEAFRLFKKLLKRTDKLSADSKAGRPLGNKTQQKRYVQRTEWCRKIAGLYLDARAGRVV